MDLEHDASLCFFVAGVDMQPVENANRQYIAVFIFFMLFGSFFVTNLFVGVVVDNFTNMKEKLGEDFLLSGMHVHCKLFRRRECV